MDKRDRHWVKPQLVGERINDLIRERNISQREFAKKLGVRDSIVSMWIWGTREPRVATVIRICETFDVSADWLLCLEKNEN